MAKKAVVETESQEKVETKVEAKAVKQQKKQKKDKTTPKTITGAIILLKESPIPLKIDNSEFLDNLSKVKIEPNKIPTGIAFANTFGISRIKTFKPKIGV